MTRFADLTGDGFGDFRGSTTRIDYLDRLGVTCI
ncbi:alpha-amylase family glycosyl hydrolase [Microvirga roseola]